MIECKDPELFSPEELALLYNQLPAIRDWINAVETEAMKLCQQDQLPGHKLVAGRSLRKWLNEDDAEAALNASGFSDEELYTKSFVTVAAAERLLGKSLFRKLEPQLVYRTEGKPVIAPLSDPRPAISAAAEFETVNA